jgi:hypothetical protein
LKPWDGGGFEGICFPGITTSRSSREPAHGEAKGQVKLKRTGDGYCVSILFECVKIFKECSACNLEKSLVFVVHPAAHVNSTKSSDDKKMGDACKLPAFE